MGSKRNTILAAFVACATGCGNSGNALDRMAALQASQARAAATAKPASSTTPAASPTSATPSTGAGTTPAAGPTPAAAAPSGLTPRARQLHQIADAYVASGDLPTALAALSAQSATPGELLQVLRGPRDLPAPVGGQQSLQVTDGFGTQTDLLVVAPPVAEVQKRAAKGLGLVVMLHGIHGNSGQTLPLGQMLAATNEVVAVAPSAQTLPAGFTPEDGIPAAIASNFPSWWIYGDPHTFALQAIRKACSLYPIDPERVVLAGASMGGFGAWNTAFRHADRFAGMIEVCGGLTRMSFASMDDPLSESLVQNGLMFPVWAAHGTNDQVVPYAQDKACADKLSGLGGDVVFHTVQNAGHELAQNIVQDPTLSKEIMTFATAKRRKSLPLSVSYVSAGTSGCASGSLDGAHWLRMTAPTAGATIQGTIDQGSNTVTISGTGTARVYLDERILDATRTITVASGGTTKWSGSLTPDFHAILDSWASREDEGLVFPAYVEVSAQ